MKTVVLVDLDNVAGNTAFETLLSFYTKDTKFVFFGIRAVHVTKINKLADIFYFHPNQIDIVMIKSGIPNGADMKMWEYVGQHIFKWKDIGVENVIVASGDKGVISLALLLNGQFQTWVCMKASTMKLQMLQDVKKLKIQLRTIKMKGC
jgi:hypothetical protein